MYSIAELEEQLKQAKTAIKDQSSDVKFPTGIVIDLKSPDGNIFAILGLCKYLFGRFGISEEFAVFKVKAQSGTYKEALALAHSWLGFIYTNAKGIIDD